MEHLLINHAEAANNYRNGIYWCTLDYKEDQHDSFDWPPMRVRLLQYCDRTGIPVPSIRDDNWFLQLLCDRDLAARTKEEDIFPTVGGYLRYASNLLEVVSFPEVIWHARTDMHKAKEVWEKTGSDWLPEFITYSGQIFTFHDLSTSINPLYTVIDPNDIGKMTIEEFTDDYGEQRLIWLINECFYRHLEAQGLWVDKDRMRAYFP